MPSSFTGNKYLELPANGAYVDTWNVPVNSDMSVIDTAFGGNVSLNATAGSATLTTAQYQPLIIFVTGAMSANVVYTIPSGIGGQWIIENSTTDGTGGPWNVVFTCAGSAYPLIVPRNATTNIFCDGTNVQFADSRTPLAAGSNQQVQYNSNGILGASPNFVFDGTNVGIGTSTPVSIGNLSVLGALASSTTRIVAGSYDYLSGPTYTATLLQQGGTSAAGTYFGLSRAGLGSLVFQNATAGLVGTDVSAPLVFGQAGLERMRITTSGYLAINTTTAAYNLTVNGIAAFTSTLAGQSTAYVNQQGAWVAWNYYGDGATNFINQNGSGNGGFQWFQSTTSNVRTEWMRIDYNGSVGIGTTTPQGKLDVQGTTNTAIISQTSNGWASFLRNSSSGQHVYDFYKVAGTEVARIDVYPDNTIAFCQSASATERMRINTSGNVGIGTASITARLNVASGSTSGGTSSQTFLAMAGTLPSSAGSDITLGTFGSSVIDNASFLSTHIYRTANSTSWYDTAMYISYDVDSSLGVGGTLSFWRGCIGISTKTPSQTLDVNGNAIIRGSTFIGPNTTVNLQGDSNTIYSRGAFVASNIGATVNYAVLDASGISTDGRIYAAGNIILSGNLGIQQTPNFPLDVWTGASRVFLSNDSGLSTFTCVNSPNNAYQELQFKAQAFHFNIAGTQTLLMDSSYNLRMYGVSGSGVAGNGIVQANGYNCKYGTDNGTMVPHAFNLLYEESSGLTYLFIDSTNIGVIYTYSDYRAKNNIQTQVMPAIERVMRLRPVTYETGSFGAIKGDGRAQEGFIAHEVGEVIPSGVIGEKDAENRLQSLNINAIVSVLTKAMQEQQALIEGLTARVAALEAA